MVRLVERDELLGQMAEAVEGARDGSGSLLLVTGEAGEGKTSLVGEAALRSARSDPPDAAGSNRDLLRAQFMRMEG